MKNSKDQKIKGTNDQKDNHSEPKRGHPLDEKVEEQEEQIDYKDKYLRALADYQNLVKRTQVEKEEFYKYAHESFIEKLIPVLDHLERAEKHTQDIGIDLLYKELRKIVEDLGLERIHIKETDEFNPAYMECIEAEQNGNKLVETRTGYRFKGKVLRPVQVKVVAS